MTYSIRFTENFTENLDAIRDYLEAQEALPLSQQLIDYVFDELVANLALFPRMGRNFLEREPHSEDGKALLARLRKRAGKEMQVREYIAGDYLILYAIRKSTIFLLSIRHHRQLSFDLKGHWV